MIETQEVLVREDGLPTPDAEDLLADCLAFVEQTIQRGLPMYLKPGAFNLLERLQAETGEEWLH